MALVGVELETLVFEPDAQTTRPPPCTYPCSSSKATSELNSLQLRTAEALNLCSELTHHSRDYLDLFIENDVLHLLSRRGLLYFSSSNRVSND